MEACYVSALSMAMVLVALTDEKSMQEGVTQALLHQVHLICTATLYSFLCHVIPSSPSGRKHSCMTAAWGREGPDVWVGRPPAAHH